MKNRYMYSAISVILILMIVISCFALSASATAQIKPVLKNKINSLLAEKMQLVTDDVKIPVYIWYADIDQNAVEKEVKAECGLSADNISVDYEMPSDELIMSYRTGSENAVVEMNAYFERTKDERAKEKEFTDKYVLVRRNVSREKYSQKANDIISAFTSLEENIIFKSEYAPAIIANLTKSDINQLKNDDRIEELGYLEPCVGSDLELTDSASEDALIQINNDAMGISKTLGLLSLTGEGVKIGMLESSCPDVQNELIDDANITIRDSVVMKDHSVNVARIMVGDVDGIAQNAQLFSARNPDAYGINDLFDYEQFEWLISKGVSIINLSYGIFPLNSGEASYAFTEKWVDHLVSYHSITVVAATGNGGLSGQRVCSPAMAHNVIGVGAYSTNYTVEHDDDYMQGYSNWINLGDEYIGVEKPDVIMPGDITTLDYVGASINDIVSETEYKTTGTSFAAPMLTGSIALMLELKPSLSAYPQAIKAIVMASCHRKVLPYASGQEEDIEDGITDRQGAGVPDVWTMACIVSQGTYGIGVLSGGQQIHRFVQPKYGASKMNVSLCWLRDNSKVDEENINNNSLNVGNYVNLDLSINYNASQQAVSEKLNSSTEMLYVDMNSSSGMYEVVVRRNSTCTDEVRYGYAYSTNSPYFSPDSTEGIFRLRNLATQEYLSLNTSTNQLLMQGYMSTNTKQEWIIQEIPTGAHNIKSAYNSVQGIANVGSIIDSYNKTVVLGTDTLNFSIFDWDFEELTADYGAVRFYTRTGATEWYFGCDESKAIISSNISSSLNGYWILERINYRRGDVDLDGDLDANDELYIQRYIADTYTFNNKQLYLADVNDDGRITTDDSTKLQKIRLGMVEF